MDEDVEHRALDRVRVEALAHREVALRIEVDEQDAVAHLAERHAEVQRRRRLRDAALLVRERDHARRGARLSGRVLRGLGRRRDRGLIGRVGRRVGDGLAHDRLRALDTLDVLGLALGRRRRRRVDEHEVVLSADLGERLLQRALAADQRAERELRAGEVDRRDGEIGLALLDHFGDRHAMDEDVEHRALDRVRDDAASPHGVFLGPGGP